MGKLINFCIFIIFSTNSSAPTMLLFAPSKNTFYSHCPIIADLGGIPSAIEILF